MSKKISEDEKRHKADAKQVMQVVDKFLAKYYGKRCKDSQALCAICQAYAVRDLLKLYVKW